MTKTLLALTGAVLLAVPSLHAQGARSFTGGGSHGAYSGGNHSSSSYAARSYGYRGNYHGGYRGGYGHHYGRYYYLGGVGYYYPFYGLGFGYPSYAYSGYWGGAYGGGPYGYGYANEGVYEGRVADEGRADEQKGASLPSAVQRQLSKRGYYKGAIDGQFGAGSRSALSKFQRDNDLKETGRIDEDTLEKLGFSDHR